MNDESRLKELTVGHGIGIFILILVATVVVSGLTKAIFGFHLSVILGELAVLVVPLVFLSTGGYSFRHFLSYRGEFNSHFWLLVGAATVFLFVVIYQADRE